MTFQQISECTERQLRQFLDARTTYEHAIQAEKNALEVRGSMLWRSINGTEYLIRNSARGKQHSLGKRSAETEQIFDRFTQRKSKVQETLRARRQALLEAKKLNRAFGVGRVPNVVVSILQELQRANMHEQFLTIGTHSLYAYEASCGVRIGSDALATQDIDLLFDTRKRVAFFSAIERANTSLIGVLQRADKTFEVMPTKLQTAVNSSAFEVDLIRRVAIDGDPHPLRMSSSEDDFWAAQIDSGGRLLSGRIFEQMVVSTNGEMAMMRTVHPLDFAEVKRALSVSPTREAIKRPRDALQAKIAAHLWEEYLAPMEAAEEQASLRER